MNLFHWLSDLLLRNWDLNQCLSSHFLFKLIQVYLMNICILNLWKINLMNIRGFTLLLRNKLFSNLDGVEFDFLFVLHLWLWSESFNLAYLEFPVLRECYVMEFRFISFSSFLTNKYILRILCKVWILESSITFRIFYTTAHCLLISRISSKINEIPK